MAPLPAEARQKDPIGYREVVRDVCLTCGRPWDGRTLPRSHTTAWCFRCDSLQRFAAQTFVPKSEAVELRVMLERLLDVALVDGYGETVRDEAEALLARGGHPSTDGPDPSAVSPVTGGNS